MVLKDGFHGPFELREGVEKRLPRSLKDDFVVDLKYHVNRRVSEKPVDLDHGFFHNIRIGPLKRGVNGLPFSKLPLKGIASFPIRILSMEPNVCHMAQ